MFKALTYFNRFFPMKPPILDEIFLLYPDEIMSNDMYVIRVVYNSNSTELYIEQGGQEQKKFLVYSVNEHSRQEITPDVKRFKSVIQNIESLKNSDINNSIFIVNKLQFSLFYEKLEHNWYCKDPNLAILEAIKLIQNQIILQSKIIESAPEIRIDL